MKRILQLEILRLLNEAAPYQMPDRALDNQLLVRVRPRPLVSEIETAKRDLETNQKILGVRTDDGIKWSVTARGKADLLEAETV